MFLLLPCSKLLANLPVMFTFEVNSIDYTFTFYIIYKKEKEKVKKNCFTMVPKRIKKVTAKVSFFFANFLLFGDEFTF